MVFLMLMIYTLFPERYALSSKKELTIQAQQSGVITVSMLLLYGKNW